MLRKQSRRLRSRRRVRGHIEELERRALMAASFLNGVEWRSIDGTGNASTDPNNPAFRRGAAETQQIRFGYGTDFPDLFGDAIITDSSTPKSRENPRTISNVIHAQNGSVPDKRLLTDWVFQWGQFITHDVDLTRTGAQFNVLSDDVTVGDFRIKIEDPNDPLYNVNNPYIPFNRSQFDPTTGDNTDVPAPFPPGSFKKNNREVINAITSYIDASMVYGSNDERADALRTFKNGKLLTTAGGKLPSFNTPGLENDNAIGLPADKLFLAGDLRANEQVNLTAVHALFVREHNRLADLIKKNYKTMNDEEIYQMARRIVGAEMQIITYEEYLPAVMGFDHAPDPDGGAYNPATNASITNAFAHAFFRFGHSQISDSTLLVNNAGKVVDNLTIAEAFFNPDFLKNNPGNVDLMMKDWRRRSGRRTTYSWSMGSATRSSALLARAASIWRRSTSIAAATTGYPTTTRCGSCMASRLERFCSR